MEQEQQRQEREKARYDAEVQKVYDYLASLPNDAAREELEQQAVATNRLWREVYYQSQGSDRHEFWRLEILKAYISKLQAHVDGEGRRRQRLDRVFGEALQRTRRIEMCYEGSTLIVFLKK